MFNGEPCTRGRRAVTLSTALTTGRGSKNCPADSFREEKMRPAHGMCTENGGHCTETSYATNNIAPVSRNRFRKHAGARIHVGGRYSVGCDAAGSPPSTRPVSDTRFTDGPFSKRRRDKMVRRTISEKLFFPKIVFSYDCVPRYATIRRRREGKCVTKY